ncbi:polyribonucleotide nucleotidyltransferase [uncultured Victivallis sp.]|uniref:polyribonucleotide nucleotidyltransferase n=1 Tax=uncultured Victivallis sp. TaxID=354118 RepID=UPI0025E730BA|nr:polyribonucleotide nucleotidyltransferase [uncultured Victivallis sp.]
MAEEKIVFQFDGERTMEISTGKVAKLANGSCLVRLGDTIVLTAACSGAPREGTDFFPLQVDYREKYSAAGKFPGGYIKREGRPSTKEILTCRMIDRPIRPLFPDYFFDEVQISSVLLSADGVNEPDVLAMVGASASLMLSDLPFQGPIGAVRVGLIDGKYVINPTRAQMEQSKLELIYAGRPGQVIMIEGEAEFVSEQQMKEAMYAADKAICKQCEAQIELAKKAGRPKKQYKLYPVPEALKKALETFCADRIEGVCTIPGKEDRMNAMDALRDDARKALRADFADMDDNQFALETAKGFDDLVRTVTRNVILTKQFRPDGRSITEIRPLSAEVGVLPVVHGSALFSRGETQALVLATLGNEKDAQEYDDLTSETGIAKKRFYLHYNFPNFSVGEVGRITGPGRREIGHGNLAERSVSKVVPKDFPYVVRCVSEIMSSNGSTSMASVCGATLALMDAGVPITAPVAGISCGLVTGENGERLLLTDIIGAEDHFGDMDFKVCGTRDGITGFQLDLKLPGIPIDLLCEGMERNRIARLKILDVIEACIPAPRPEVSSRAPRLEVIQINPEKIGALIGPGGKNIRAITEETGTSIDIEEDGSVKIMAPDKAHLEAAKERILGSTAEAEIGKIYRGKVVTIRDFGAFVEILPGVDGLLHISEMADYRVNKVTDICEEGQYVTVKVIDIDQSGKIRLSRKAALKELGE